jgi:hypothetical protein
MIEEKLDLEDMQRRLLDRLGEMVLTEQNEGISKHYLRKYAEALEYTKEKFPKLLVGNKTGEVLMFSNPE